MNNLKNITQDGDKLVLKSGTSICPSSGTQASHIADMAADSDVTVTTDLTGVDTGTDMTAAQAAQIETDLAAIVAKLNGDTTDLETKINAIFTALENIGVLASS